MINLFQPVFFERNRVFRVYEGGLGLRAFGSDDKADGIFPEEWLASKVKAINQRYFGKRDGVSVIEGTDVFLDDLLRQYPNEMLGGKEYDCLIKFLDSAIRLPVQVHPTKEFSRKHFNSEYGKTESWLVIATRENAKLHFGFNKKYTPDELAEFDNRSENEKDVLETITDSIEAKVGDIYLIKAGLVHAIGAGCTILEVQEPTDFTIQPENWCGSYHLNDYEKYMGLDQKTAISCFDTDYYGEAAVKAITLNPRVTLDDGKVKREELITYADTPCFAENRYTLRDGGAAIMPEAPSVWVVIDGEAEIRGDGYNRNVKKGDYFFLPYAAKGKFEVTAPVGATLIECLPSKQ